jgi:hypothetical protein
MLRGAPEARSFWVTRKTSVVLLLSIKSQAPTTELMTTTAETAIENGPFEPGLGLEIFNGYIPFG